MFGSNHFAAGRIGSVGGVETWEGSEDRRATGALHRTRVAWRVRVGCLQGRSKLGWCIDTPGAGFNGRVNGFTRVDSARPVADQ